MFFLVLAVLALPAAGGRALKVNGSSTVTPVVADAADLLQQTAGLEIVVDPAGGSSGGISALGDGRVDMAMSSRPLEPGDHSKFPSTDFRPVTIGYDAVAMVVSRDVWQGGVHALSRQQVRDIYEGRIKRWSAVGGPDRRIVFFDKEPGRGTWAMFAKWAYGDTQKAPLVSFPKVGSNQETRTKVASTPGAMSQLSASWTDGETIFALGIRRPDASVVYPTREEIAAGHYPIRRPLLVITDGPATGAAKTLLDLLLSERGQALVEKHGYLPLEKPAATEAH